MKEFCKILQRFKILKKFKSFTENKCLCRQWYGDG